MPVKLLNLDDRTYADLFAEAGALIPRYAPDWTDHNTSDPGIMLLELFAWLTEAMLYRINRVSDASRAPILKLLGVAFQPAQPAMLNLRVRVESWPTGVDRYEVQRELPIWGNTASGARVPFEVMRTVKFTREDSVREVILRQTQLIPSRETSTGEGVSRQLEPPPGRALARTQASHLFELVGLGEQFLVLPPEPRPWRPRVTVADKSWTLVDSLQDLEPASTCCFAFRPGLNAIAFGGEQRAVDGKTEETGRIPPQGAKIRVTYRGSPNPRAMVTDEFTSTGEAWQVHRLSRPLCQLDLRAPSDLEPCLVSQDWTGTPTTWEYVADFLHMTAGGAQYTFEPWHNAIRFGGYSLDPHTLLSFQGRFTLGAQGDLADGNWFSGWPRSDSSDKLPLRLAIDSWEVLARGRSPTTLDETRHQIDAMLRPDWRAVTADDFGSVIRNNLPDIARVVCLPGHRTSDDEGQVRPGYVGIIVVPDRTAELTASSQQLYDILASAPEARRLVAKKDDDAISLWNMDTGECIRALEGPGASGVAFSPNGRRLLTCAPDVGASSSTWTAKLWDARTGAQLKDLNRSTSPARFSTTGRWLVSMHEDGARLRDANDGATIHPLPGAPSWDCLAFGPDDTSLLAANGDRAHLWILADGQEPHDVLADAPAEPGRSDKPDETGWAGPFRAAAYNREGTCAAVAAEDGRVRVWQLRPDSRKMLAVRRQIDIRLGHHGPAHSLLLDPAGTRIITQSAGGITALWSARTGALLADLSLADRVNLLALSGDGRWLAAAHADRTVRIWDAVSGSEIKEPIHNTAVEALLFAPDRPQLITITSAHKRKYILGAWSLESGAIQKVATHVISESPPVIHTSGRWLAYADKRLVHVWDTARAADISAIYVHFDDAAVVLDYWRLDPADSLRDKPLGMQVAAAAPIALTDTKYLRITSALGLSAGRNRTRRSGVGATAAPSSTFGSYDAAAPPSTTGTVTDTVSEGRDRTVQFWDAEHVYEAEEVLADRRLVTTRVEIGGPIYTGVTVKVVVVRRSPTIEPLRLKEKINAALSHFFDPLHGGPDGTGWPLARPVYISEICQVVEAVDGVDHVKTVSQPTGPIQGPEQWAIPPHSLVTCDIDIEVRS